MQAGGAQVGGAQVGGAQVGGAQVGEAQVGGAQVGGVQAYSCFYGRSYTLSLKYNRVVPSISDNHFLLLDIISAVKK